MGNCSLKDQAEDLTWESLRSHTAAKLFHLLEFSYEKRDHLLQSVINDLGRKAGYAFEPILQEFANV